MVDFLDVCRFIPTAGGTTDWTYSSAVTGYQSPTAAGVVNGTTYSYRAESADLTQWEVGTGAYNTGTGVLARTAVLFNNLGTTAKINFASAPQVGIVGLAEDVPSLTKGTNTFTGAIVVSGNSSTFLNSSTPSGTNNTLEATSSLAIVASSNAVAVPSTTSGLVLVTDISVSGKVALFILVNTGAALLLGGSTGHLWSNTTTPAASNFGFAHDGTNFRIYNGFASTINFRVMSLSLT